MSKGSKPRNCFSQAFRDNHDSIDWSKGRVARQTVPSTTEQILIKDYATKSDWVIPPLSDFYVDGRPSS